MHGQTTTTIKTTNNRSQGGGRKERERRQQQTATYREGVAANIVRADGQVGDLEVLDAVDVQSRIQDTVLDNAVALSRSHGAGAQAVPCGFAVSLNPFLNVGNWFHHITG